MSAYFDRAALVDAARDSIARGSKSFAVASKLLDPVMRERAWLLYAWCRECDDIIDGQTAGLSGRDDTRTAAENIAFIKLLTADALAGRRTGNDAFDALGCVAAEAGLPQRYVWDLVEGFVLDVDRFSPQTEDDLYRYCYHVAGSVGLMMAIVMGVNPDDAPTLDRACDLGMAFQLSNIARDVGEDAASGRCYLPHEWLVKVGLDQQDIPDPAHGVAVADLTAMLADRAEAYERSARVGTRALSFRASWAVLAAAGIYGDIARQVRRKGPAAISRRVITSKSQKLAWVVRSGMEALLRASISCQDRADLWARPR